MAARKKASSRKTPSRPRKQRKADQQETRPNSHLLNQTGPDSFLERYLEGTRRGMKLGDRAFYAGCDPSTPREWIEIADEDFAKGRETMHTRFVIAVRRASSEDTYVLLGVLRDAAGTDWRAAIAVLDRRGYTAPKQIQVAATVQTGQVDADSQDEMS